MDQSNSPQHSHDSPTRHAMRGAINHRRSHRQRAHDQAHDQQTTGGGGEVAVVVTQGQLQDCVDRLSRAKLFAFDTEFIGELTYRPQLCLVQVAVGEQVDLIDTMSRGLDLAPLWALMVDPSVAKVVHAGEQDLQHIWRFTRQGPQNVFDTQVAAGFVGLGASTSLAKLALEITGKKIAKGFTLTDWSRRPLSSSQLRYAADDVRYLCEIYRELKSRVDACGHTDWVTQECALRCSQARTDHAPSEAFNRVRGYTSLEPKQQGMLRELAAWREVAAKEADLPPRSLVRDEVLVEIVRRVPNTSDKLASIKGLPHPIVSHHSADIFHALNAGKAQPTVEPTPTADTDDSIVPSEKFRLEVLFGVAHVICSARSIDPALVASKKDIQDFIYKTARGLSVAESPLSHGWRKQLLGDRLLAWMNGQSPLTLAWKEGRLTSL